MLNLSHSGCKTPVKWITLVVLAKLSWRGNKIPHIRAELAWECIAQGWYTLYRTEHIVLRLFRTFLRNIQSTGILFILWGRERRCSLFPTLAVVKSACKEMWRIKKIRKWVQNLLCFVCKFVKMFNESSENRVLIWQNPVISRNI